MELHECKAGTPVAKNEKNRRSVKLSPEDVGHIVRFSFNSLKEIVVLVAWADDREYGIHPANIEPL